MKGREGKERKGGRGEEEEGREKGGKREGREEGGEQHIVYAMYCVARAETYSADPDHSHSDSIVGLDVTHKLRLFASCSLDCTIRIWSEDNFPLR